MSLFLIPHSLFLLATTLATLPPRPTSPGPETWKFREELASFDGALEWKPSGEPWLKDRLSRCTFGPIKREPFNRDELMDDIDYYPDGYLEKLRRDGVNGLWITVEFHEIAETRFFPRDPNAERRLNKLRLTVEKCARYGIKIWLFALEPKWLKEDHPFRRANPEMFVQRGDHFAMCPELPAVKEYLSSAAFDVFSRVPGLGGFIGITHGEDITSCFSYAGVECPRCEKLSMGRLHHDLVGAIAAGVRRANPKARVISWFYQPEAQVTRPNWVKDCVANLPEGVSLMFNFESGILVKQCDRWRVGGDYWLSQPGPGAPFAALSEAARLKGARLAAKIQTACSHEIATLPYIPVPGLLYRKFQAMKESGVETAMLNWYFGNFPCLMSRAAGRLAYSDFSENEETFLLRLASEDWGSEAPKVVALWQDYAKAYSNYPISNYMQYYGPFHAGVVWALYPHVEMRMLEPTWMPHYDPAGDAIGECLRDFDLDEALSLATAAANMPEPDLAATNRAQRLDVGVLKALRRQFISSRNIFDFYRQRSEAIYQSRVLKRPEAARKCVRKMKNIILAETKLTQEMIPLCEDDSRLGFHSEAEAYQYFPERLRWRLDALKRAMTDLESIDEALSSDGYYPESEWEKSAPRLVVGESSLTKGAEGFAVRVRYLDDGAMQIEGEVVSSIKSLQIAMYDAAATTFPLVYGLSKEGRLTAPVWNGESRQAEPAMLRTEESSTDDWRFCLTVPSCVWKNNERLQPKWMFCYTDDGKSLWPSPDNAKRVRRLWHPLNPQQFGRLKSVADCAVTQKISQSFKIIDQDLWYGFRRTTFDFNGRKAWVVEPSVDARKDLPWTWTMQWAESFVDRTGVLDLLRKGYHHVTIDLFDTRMDETGLATAAAFQAFLTEKLGFAPKANLVGMSWGGFFSVRYANKYPQNIRKIYLDAPLLIFTGFSMPNDIGPWLKNPPENNDWQTDAQMPINMASSIAKEKIPLLLIYGGQDQTVPAKFNSDLFVVRFKAAGGNIEVHKRGGFGHHPHGVDPDKTKVIQDFFTSE